jgi:hypothetical protein
MEEKQSNLVFQGSSPGPSPFLGSSSTVLEYTNPAEVLRQLTLIYAGMEDKADGTVGEAGERLMNDEGINKMLNLLKPIVNDNTTRGDLEADEIEMLMLDLADAMYTDFQENRRKYGIKDIPTKKAICKMALQVAFISLKRSYQGGERETLKGSMHDNSINSPQKSGGILDSILSLGRRR